MTNTDRKRYLDLLKKVLIDLHRIDAVYYSPGITYTHSLQSRILKNFADVVRQKRDYYLCKRIEASLDDRLEGHDWPMYSETMIGYKRLDNIHYCYEQIVKDGIEGDMIETGVWRGGACIFMNALVQSYNEKRQIWVCDSFEGLPKPNEAMYPEDKGDIHHQYNALAVSLEQVKANFKRYDLLTENVKFLKGWFSDTLPTIPAQKFALVRLDGDMYESTMDALVNLYHKLEPGGYLIVDDYALGPCKKAINDFRDKHSITEEIIQIDSTGVYWRKSI